MALPNSLAALSRTPGPALSISYLSSVVNEDGAPFRLLDRFRLGAVVDLPMFINMLCHCCSVGCLAADLNSPYWQYRPLGALLYVLTSKYFYMFILPEING